MVNKFQDVSLSQGDLLVARYEAIYFYVVEECPNCQQFKAKHLKLGGLTKSIKILLPSLVQFFRLDILFLSLVLCMKL